MEVYVRIPTLSTCSLQLQQFPCTPFRTQLKSFCKYSQLLVIQLNHVDTKYLMVKTRNMKIGVVTEVSTFLAITQVSSGLHFSSLANISTFMLRQLDQPMYNPVSPQIQFIYGKCLALYSLSVLPLRLSSLTEDISMTTVYSCVVKLQEVLSGLKKKLKHWTYTCTFVAFLNIICICVCIYIYIYIFFFFYLECNFPFFCFFCLQQKANSPLGELLQPLS